MGEQFLPSPRRQEVTMKAVFFLLCTLGAASAILIKANQEHVFSYSGKILTGIPELDQTYSGIAIDASVILQAGANNDPFNNMYKLALREVKIANFNEKLNGAKPLNWRHMEVPSTSPVPEAFKAFLESPVEIELEAGEVKKVILSSEEPEWSVNFKKALVSVLKVRLPAEKAMSNMITRGQDIIPDSWSVMEQGIDGVCMNLYQVTEVPAHLAREMEQKLMKPELCQGMKMFEIVRNRDLTQCTVNSLYIASRQHENCLVGNCEGVTGKSTETRFLGCGEHKDAVTLHLVINEGELQQNLLAFNTEKVITGTKQMLVLKEVKSTKTVLPAIAAPRTVEDVVYEYPKEVTPEERMQVTNFKKQQEFYRNKAQDPSNLLITPSARLVAMDQQMKTKIVEKVRETARYLEEIENFGDKKAPSHLKSLQSALSFLKKEEIKFIFSEVKDRKVERSVFMEALLMAGTNPTIMFAKEMIISKELTDMETAQVMITLPHYVKMPTPKLIEELFELISHPAVTVNPVIKSNAYIAFATIVRKACFPSAKPRAVFPRMIVGDVCDPNDVRITEKYIPYLVAELRKIDQPQVQGVMLALGAIGHPSVLPVLLPYIEGKVPTADIAIRKVAIYALSPVAQKYRNVLLPVLSARLHDQGEHSGVRVAAFTTMLPMEPSLVDWHKMARFVFFTLQSLAQMKESEIAANSKLMDLTLKAKSVFPLAKPIPGIHSITYGEFVNRLMKDLGISYQTYETQMRYQHSMDYFYKLDFFLKNVRETRFEEYWASGGLHTFIIDAFQVAISNSQPKMHEEMRKLMEKLEIAPKQESVMWVDQWFRLYDDMTLSIQSPRLGIQDVKEKMREVLTNSPKWIEEVKSSLCGKTPFHMIKAHQTIPYMAMVPSEMGFPIWIETEVTYLNSLKGEVDVDCSMTLPALDVKMTPKFSYAWSSYAGVVSPFTMELLAAGVSSHRAVNIPVRTEIRIEPTTGTLKIDMKHVDEVTAQTASVDIHHLHVIPFTTKKPFNFVDLTPIAVDMRNTKILQSASPKKTFETRMGERLGLDIKLQVESECDVLDKKTVMDTMNRYNYHPFHYWMFLATETAQKLDGSPTLRYHKYTLVHNPRDSTTKEMKAEIKLSGALKYKEGEIVKHIPSGSEKKTLQEQKLSRSIQELTSVDDVQATNVLMEIALIGGAPKTCEVSLTAAHGFSELSNKWNLHLEMEKDTPRMVCMAGVMERNVQGKVMYNNRLGFGSSCDEHFVMVEGMVASTDRQRELSRNTEEARRCDRLSRKIQEKQG